MAIDPYDRAAALDCFEYERVKAKCAQA